MGDQHVLVNSFRNKVKTPSASSGTFKSARKIESTNRQNLMAILASWKRQSTSNQITNVICRDDRIKSDGHQPKTVSGSSLASSIVNSPSSKWLRRQITQYWQKAARLNLHGRLKNFQRIGNTAILGKEHFHAIWEARINVFQVGIWAYNMVSELQSITPLEAKIAAARASQQQRNDLFDTLDKIAPWQIRGWFVGHVFCIKMAGVASNFNL